MQRAHSRARAHFTFALVAAALAPQAAGQFDLPGTQPKLSGSPFDPETQILDLFIAPNAAALGQACSDCHLAEIGARPMAAWNGSMMAQSARDPLFFAQLDLANTDDALRPEVAGIGDLCLRCHSPVGWLEGRSTDHSGMGFQSKDTFGVQCHFCHRLVDPLLEGLPPLHFDETEMVDPLNAAGGPGSPPTYGNGMYVVDRTHMRRGPYSAALLTAHAGQVVPDDIPWSTGLNAYDHPVSDSPFHRSGNLCGTCHDVSLPFDCADGSDVQTCFPIERTWTEWRHSAFYALGESGNCQSCHMSGPLNGFAFGAVCEGGDALGHLNDVHFHDLTGGNDFVPRMIRWMKERYDSDPATTCAVLGVGTPAYLACIDAENDFKGAVENLYPPAGADPFEHVDLSALDVGRERVARNLARSAYLTAELDTVIPTLMNVRIENRTGHKLPTGYPEGRRMWLNVAFFDAAGVLLAESGRYDVATASLYHDQDLDGATTPATFYDVVAYTDAVGNELAIGRPTKVWEGRTEHGASHTEFHFALNDVWRMDNRIPPLGWDPVAYATNRASPVIPALYSANGWQSDYLDSGGGGENWDDVVYAIPSGTDRAELVLYYQTASREYIEAIVADHPGAGDPDIPVHVGVTGTFTRATLLDEAWQAVGRSEPVEMTRTVLAVVDTDADGLPDGWEALHGVVGGFNDDQDADGLNNWQELLYGTDPATPAPDLREPVDIVLVLDLSGSMNDPAPGSSIPKVDLLRDAVTLFLETWSDYAVPDDQIAVVTFQTTADFLPETPGLVSFVDEWQTIDSAVRVLSASGWTAMGAGLYKALEELDALDTIDDPLRTQHVILFSNGMQNRSPIVASDSDFPTTHIEVREPIVGDISVTGASNPELAGVDGTIPDPGNAGAYVHTIGLGVGEDPGGTAWHETLKEIADKQGGEHVFITDAFQLEGTFLESLVQALRFNTIEYVLEADATLKPGETRTFDIPINASATKFSVVISWSQAGGVAPAFALERPDGITEDLGPLMRGGSFYRVVARFLDDVDHHPEQFGIWRLAVTMPKTSRSDEGDVAGRQGGPTTIRVHALLDDEDVHYAFQFNGPDLRVGQPLLVMALARQGDRNLLRVDEVSVTVDRPLRSVGAELARSRHAAIAPAGLDPDLGARPLDLKMYAAFADPAFTRRLRPVTERYELTDDGLHGDNVARDGRFERRLFTPTVPGHYLLHFRMKAYAHDGSPVVREETRSLFVRPGPVVLEASDPRLTLTGGAWQLDISPADASGNLLGPGYGPKISVSTNGRRLAVEDRLDGSYRATMPAGFDRSTPVSIEVWNEPVHDGPIPEPQDGLGWLWILLVIVLAAIFLILILRR